MATLGQRWLIGCGLGCAAALLAVVVAIVIGVSWLNKPGELLRPETLLGEDTTGYVQWTLRVEDPGTELFVRELVTALRDVRETAAMPSVIGDIVQHQRTASDDELRKIFPVVLAWTERPGATPDRDSHLVTASIERLGNRLAILDMFMGFTFKRDTDGNASVDDYRDEKVYIVRGDSGLTAAFFIRGNDVFITSDAETARQAVDRLLTVPSDEAPAREATGLERLYALAPSDQPLRGAVANERGELARLVRRLQDARHVPAGDEPLWRATRGATLAAHLEPDGSLGGTLVVHAPDAAWASANAPALEGSIVTAIGPDVGFESSSSVDGDRVVVTFLCRDVASRFASWLQSLDDDEHEQTETDRPKTNGT